MPPSWPIRFYMVVINTPILVTALLYAKLFLVARKHAAAIAAQPGERTAGHSDHAWRYAKTVLLIVGVYFACWVPMGMQIIAVYGSVEGRCPLGRVPTIGTQHQAVFLSVSPFRYSCNPLTFQT